MREVFVNDDAFHQHGVLHPSAHLAFDLDQLKVDVLAFNVSHRQNGVDGNLRHHSVALVDDLGA